ncbi:MAG: hypothetical protein KVP17_000245 [Porospora cf. gigantea B]|nr:MAG: hypothetical protein KVP17_000245 [Porospora cf. gigantea B]
MVEEAERFKDEDESNRQKIDAKNSLENYCFSVRNSIKDDNLKGKMDAADIEAAEAKVTELLSWLDNNQFAEKDEFDEKYKELEAVFNPIMQKVYAAAGGEGGMPGGMDMGGMGGASSGPTVEEVD